MSRNNVTESFWMVWWWLVGVIVWNRPSANDDLRLAPGGSSSISKFT
ncbi:MAG: hypothetical protein O9346_15025 [Leptospiraceae bacterium]|nr:hypothetical protein [Leptospiraceae bacterium]